MGFGARTVSPSRYGMLNVACSASATEVLPQPAGPVMTQMCLGAIGVAVVILGCARERLLKDGGVVEEENTAGGEVGRLSPSYTHHARARVRNQELKRERERSERRETPPNPDILQTHRTGIVFPLLTPPTADAGLMALSESSPKRIHPPCRRGLLSRCRGRHRSACVPGAAHGKRSHSLRQR